MGRGGGMSLSIPLGGGAASSGGIYTEGECEVGGGGNGWKGGRRGRDRLCPFVPPGHVKR